MIDSYTGHHADPGAVRARSAWTKTWAWIFSAFPAPTAPAACTAGGRTSASPSYSNIGYAGSNNSPYIDDNWQAQYTANASWTKGSHTLRFGGDIVRQALNRFETGSGSGAFTFGGGPTTIQGGPSANSSTISRRSCSACPRQIAKSVIPFEDNHDRSRNWQFSLFAKDQWQVARALTASLGVRWDYFPMGTRTTSGLERYDSRTIRC